MIGMKAETACLTARDRRNRRPLLVWSLVWAASFLAVHLFFPEAQGGPGNQPAAAWLMVAVSAGAGIMVAVSYVRFVRGLDELWRAVHVDALAIGFGAAFVFGMVASLLYEMGIERLGALTWVVLVLANAIALRWRQRQVCA